MATIFGSSSRETHEAQDQYYPDHREESVQESSKNTKRDPKRQKNTIRNDIREVRDVFSAFEDNNAPTR